MRASHQLVFWMKIQGSAHTVPAGVTDDYAYAASNSNTAHFNATHRAPTSVFDLPHDLTVGNASGTYTTATNIIVT